MDVLAVLLSCLFTIAALAQESNEAADGEEADLGSDQEEATEPPAQHFSFETDVWIPVAPARARAILLQYENIPHLNDTVRGVEVLERRDDGTDRVRFRARVCVLLFCQDYGWTQEVSRLESGDILAVFDPHESDFRSGRVLYRFQPEDNGTRFVVEAELEPTFWFPPVVGPWLIEQEFARQAVETGENIVQVELPEIDRGTEIDR